MNITVLDGYTLNPGDLDWSPLSFLAGKGTFTVYDRTPPSRLLKNAKDAEVLLTNKTVLTAKDLEQLPKLKYIGILATGYNVVDLAAARKRRITVTNIPSYGTFSVAQHTFALLLELTQHVHIHSQSIFAGDWTVSKDFSYQLTPLMELAGKKLGIIGFGEIGKQIGKIGSAFGMEIIYFTRTPLNSEEIEALNYPAKAVSKSEIFTMSDVLSLNCPLNDQTKEIINEQTLAMMKNEAILINTGRGGLINESDLAAALMTKTIAAYAGDVLSSEPPKRDNPLLKAPNCLLTPHIAWKTKEARSRLLTIAANNLLAFLKGDPINVIRYTPPPPPKIKKRAGEDSTLSSKEPE